MPMPRTRTAPRPAASRTWRSVEFGASYLDVSTRTIRRKIANGELRAYRVGGLIRIDQADLDALIRPIPTAGNGAA